VTIEDEGDYLIGVSSLKRVLKVEEPLFVEIVSAPSTVERYDFPRVEIETIPGAKCSIAVTCSSEAYTSFTSSFDLRDKDASDGTAYWSWFIDSNATTGPCNVTITAKDGNREAVATTQITIEDIPATKYSPGVEYRVTGTCSRVDVTYQNSDGGTSQVTNKSLPWSYTFTGGTGDFVYVSAQNQEKNGSVTCTIYRNGNVFKTSTSSGAYVIATASGSL